MVLPGSNICKIHQFYDFLKNFAKRLDFETLCNEGILNLILSKKVCGYSLPIIAMDFDLKINRWASQLIILFVGRLPPPQE